MIQRRCVGIQRDGVAVEVFQDSAVIINLADGTYYSTDGVGAFIVDRLDAGADVVGLVEAVVARYQVDATHAQRDVERLVRELRDERLVVERDASADAVPREPWSGERQPYRAPELRAYRDMAAMLALDPPMPRLDAARDVKGRNEPR